MIGHDSMLLQSILDQPRNFALVTAQRLARYVRNEFDPRSDACWQVADKLWRAALLTRDVVRTSPARPRVINGHKIRTSYNHPPIPVRDMDWSAVTDDYEPGHPTGYGRTEQDAIDDLLAHIEAGQS